MKILSLFSVLLIGPGHSAFGEDEPLNSILVFSDNTRITGQARSINSEEEILNFTSPSLQGNASLKTSELLEMTLDGTPKVLESDHYALATIKPHYDDPHQDTLRGRLIQLDDETITLDTWYAGQLILKRSLVHSLDIFKPSFFSGPSGPEGWVTSEGSLHENWTFKNRSMISKNRRGIARKVTIPDRAIITASAQWKGTPSFRILFFSDDASSNHPEEGYALNVQSTSISLYRTEAGERSKEIVNQRINSIRGVEKIDIAIYIDRTKNGTSAIYLDGKKIGTWTDTDDTALTGKWLHFVPGSSTNPLQLSKIAVSQWDGALPTRTESEPADEEDEFKLKGQKIRLANGDVVVGSIQKINNDLVHLDTDFGKVRIPLRRMKSLALAPISDEDRMEINDVRAWFHEGGYVTIKLKSFDGKTIKGYSQVYGDAEFDVNAFSRIQFNIWNRDLDLARIGGEIGR